MKQIKIGNLALGVIGCAKEEAITVHYLAIIFANLASRLDGVRSADQYDHLCRFSGQRLVGWKLRL